jgi:alpha-tubulin suppressor-like RCC1 family protein
MWCILKVNKNQNKISMFQNRRKRKYLFKFAASLSFFICVVISVGLIVQNTKKQPAQAAGGVITNVYPNIVPTSGGNKIKVSGNNFVYSNLNISQRSTGGTATINKLADYTRLTSSAQTIINKYAIGNFTGTVNIAGTNYTSQGGSDIFVLRMDENNQIMWVHTFGTVNDDYGSDINLDNNANLYFVGTLGDGVVIKDSNLTPVLPASGIPNTAFLASYINQGWTLDQPTHAFNTIVAGSGGESFGEAISIDSTVTNTSIYIVGSFQNTITFGTNSLTSVGGYDFFVSKYNVNTSTFSAFRGGGTLDDDAKDVAFDTLTHDYYVTGSFGSLGGIAMNVQSQTITGGGLSANTTGYVLKFDSNGNYLSNILAETNLGSVSIDKIVVDRNNGDIIFASNNDQAFVLYSNSTFGTYSNTPAGAILSYTSSGVFKWGNVIDGSGQDTITDISIGQGAGFSTGDNLAVSGTFEGVADVTTTELQDGGSTLNPEQITSQGGKDAFIASYGNGDGALKSVVPIGSPGSGDTINTTLGFDNLFAGTFTGTVNYGGNTLTATNQDFYIANFNTGVSSSLGGVPSAGTQYVSPQTIYITTPPFAGSTLQITFGDSSQATLTSAINVYSNTAITDGVNITGGNAFGQLGNGSTFTTDSNTPVPVPSIQNIKTMLTGNYFNVVVKNDGTVWTWGQNNNGQLGNGTTVNSDFPVQVSGINTASKAFAGSDHVLILLNDGTVKAWGLNDAGQLGDGTNIDKTTPITVPGLTNVVDVNGGDSFSSAVKSDGTLWVWGENFHGQLGQGTSGMGTDINTPTQVPGINNVSYVENGHYHMLVVKNDGTLWSWGMNSFGQLGQGIVGGTINTPTQITGITNVSKVSGGNYFSMALKTDGTVWMWGKNDGGVLGRGYISSQAAPTVQDATPTQILGLSNIQAIAAGGMCGGIYESAHALALNSSGQVYSWGDNESGQLGSFNNSPRYTPSQINLNGSIVNQIYAGAKHSAFITGALNPAPIAVNDNKTTPEDTATTIDILANDTDQNGSSGGGGGGGFLSISVKSLNIDTSTVTIVTNPTHGTITSINSTTGVVSYTPALNYNGSDSFVYNVKDDLGAVSNNATVTLSITPVNDNPVANNDNPTTPEDTPITINVLANDTDVDGDTLTICTPSGFTQPTHGNVTQVGNNLLYTPAANYFGPDTFTYTACDGNGGTSTATVNITITSVNDSPVANPDTPSTPEGTPVSVNVLVNDTDIEGDALSICTVNGFTQGAHGTVTQVGNNLLYTPTGTYTGSDSFTYTACDGNGGSSTTTVTVSVTPVGNQGPTMATQTLTIKKGETKSFPGYTANDPENNTPLTFTTSAIDSNLNCTQSNSGQTGNVVTCTPSLSLAVGSYTFTVTPSDSFNTPGNTVTYTINVQNPDNAQLDISKNKPDANIATDQTVTVEAAITNPNNFALSNVVTTLAVDTTKVSIVTGSQKEGSIQGQKYAFISSLLALPVEAQSTNTFQIINASTLQITIPQLAANQTIPFVFDVTARTEGVGQITGSTQISSIPDLPPVSDQTTIPISNIVTTLVRTGGQVLLPLVVGAILVFIAGAVATKTKRNKIKVKEEK